MIEETQPNTKETENNNNENTDNNSLSTQINLFAIEPTQETNDKENKSKNKKDTP